MTNLTHTLRRGLAALTIAAIAATSTLPGTAAAQGRSFGFDGSTVSERVQTDFRTGKGAETATSKWAWKCGYVTKRKGKYRPSHVRIKKYKKQVNCYEELKGKKPIVVRGFKASISDKAVRKSVADSANRI